MARTAHHNQRLIQIHCNNSKVAFIVTNFYGYEAISELFQYNLTLLSANLNCQANDILGHGVSGNIIDKSQSKAIHFSGIVRHFVVAEKTENNMRRYYMKLVPGLWQLTLKHDYRIFQKQTVPQIVEKILEDFGLQRYCLQKLRNDHPKRKYCIQYNETSFEFISRLLEEENIIYYFQHEQNDEGNNRHILILTDHQNANPCFSEPVHFKDEAKAYTYLYSWREKKQLIPNQITLNNDQLHTSNTHLNMSTQIPTQQATQKLEHYIFPSHHKTPALCDQSLRQHIAIQLANQNKIYVSGNYLGMHAAMQFSLHTHHLETKYVINAIEHYATDKSHLEHSEANTDEPEFAQRYHNQFRCILIDHGLAPQHKSWKTIAHGPELAVVVGPKNQQIYTDQHGRIKLRFHWDRRFENDTESCCWAYVNQQWKDRRWGMQFIPRIGQSVLVDFINGNPDEPIIIGCLFNATHKTPYHLPKKAYLSGIKTQSINNLVPAGNEICFNDRAGHEGVYLQAEKDFLRIIGGSLITNVRYHYHCSVNNEINIKIEEGQYLLEAKEQIILKAGESQIIIHPNGIDIKGKIVSFN